MKTALVDTNILIDYLKGKQEAVPLFERFHKDGSMLICSLITKLELLSGIRPDEEEVLQDFLDAFEMVGLDDLIAEEAGCIFNYLLYDATASARIDIMRLVISKSGYIAQGGPG